MMQTSLPPRTVVQTSLPVTTIVQTSTATGAVSTTVTAAQPSSCSVTSQQSSVAHMCHGVLHSLEVNEQFDVLSDLFAAISMQEVPKDFLHLAAKGMQNLRNAGRSNSIYLLAKALGTMRKDGSDSLLPVKRMPMGLIEYAVAFFTASSVQKVWLHSFLTLFIPLH